MKAFGDLALLRMSIRVKLYKELNYNLLKKIHFRAHSFSLPSSLSQSS